MRKATIIVWLTLLLGAIAALFWRTDWIYSLPTPVPPRYVAVDFGNGIKLPAQFNPRNNKPVFLHFFNPRCPCSKFNIPHFKSLVKEYGDKVDFTIVVMSDREYSEKDIQAKFNLQIAVVFDTAIAKACGVYSTPQAVLLTPGLQLYYRGNYNRTRYCTDKNSEYAKKAIDALLAHTTNIQFDRHALIAYGCQVPKCTK
ncbi:MAG: hypothetical protein ABIT05_12015 [Chitinophagaceae bacterium]